MTDDWYPGDATGVDPRASLDLWDYRRRVHEMYGAVRHGRGGEDAWLAWRAARDDLFATHSQSAIDVEARSGFKGIRYFPYDPGWRFEVEADVAIGESVAIGNSGSGATAFRRLGTVRLPPEGQSLTLTLYWLEGYGGGVFLPFRDASSGRETYWGGRYLLDTVKGADLGHSEGKLVLDFNYAYHPSCVYNPRWSCPLAPQENWLTAPIAAGERLP
ncbi:MAG: DUF1684 domain-containing protein [Actinomycetota bacterium]